MLVRCIEGNRSPSVVTLSVETGTVFSIFMLEDALDGDAGLRVTILRREGELPPVQAALVVELEVIESNGGALFSARAIGKKVTLDLDKGDRRSRAVRKSEIRSGTRVDVAAGNWKRFDFTLYLQQENESDTLLATASGSRSAHTMEDQRSSLWRVPTAGTIVRNAGEAIKAEIRTTAASMGLSAETSQYFVGMVFFLLAAGYGWYNQYQKTQSAQAETVAAQSALERANMARAASLQGEQACLGERKLIADQLDNQVESLKMKADLALMVSASRSTALEIGGGRYTGDDLMAIDASYLKNLQDLLLQQLKDWKEPLPDVASCTKLANLLPDGMPGYSLLWHPDPAVICPAPEYQWIVDGTAIIGRWGLSDRTAHEFGVPDGALIATVPEPRIYPRWSYLTFLEGYQASLKLLLQYQGTDRATVAPSEAQLWALAIFSAYNRIPTIAAGTLAAPLSVCMEELLDQRAQSTQSARPGEPLLPPISSVLRKETEWKLQKTPACAWPAEAMLIGAESATRAVVVTAMTESTP